MRHYSELAQRMTHAMLRIKRTEGQNKLATTESLLYVMR